MWCFYWKKVSQCVIHAERWMFCLPLSKLTREGADSSASKRRLRSHGCIYECLILIESKVCLIFLLSQELYIGDSSWIVIQSTTGGHICPICPSGVIMWFFLCKSSVADKIRRQQKWPRTPDLCLGLSTWARTRLLSKAIPTTSAVHQCLTFTSSPSCHFSSASFSRSLTSCCTCCSDAFFSTSLLCLALVVFHVLPLPEFCCI